MTGDRARTATVAQPVLVVRGLSKVYDGDVPARVPALDGVSFEVERGDFVSITGPSGSGKTTLLHLIGGLDVPSAGEISIDGRDIARLSDDERTILRRRKIGIVFQFFNLLPALTVAENVALPLLLDGMRFRDTTDRVDRMLDRVGLRQRSRHLADRLSGGEMQRVSIARALVTEPELLLADEPTGNLDSQSGETVLRLIRDLNAHQGHTVLLVTHDRRAAAYAHRHIFLRDGRISPGEGGDAA